MLTECRSASYKIKQGPSNWFYSVDNSIVNIESEEYSPCKRTIKINYRDTLILESIDFPHMQFHKYSFINQYANFYHYMINARIGERLLTINLPNFYKNTAIAGLGELTNNEYVSSKDVALEEVIDFFWFSSFYHKEDHYKRKDNYFTNEIRLYFPHLWAEDYGFPNYTYEKIS
jgi:hypothetical protein